MVGKGVPIKGYPNYLVEPNGKIYSLYTQKYLKPYNRIGGYQSVELFDDNGKSKRVLVHRIVAIAFIPNPRNLPQVNHIDENKSNNSAENLEWCTAKYNMNYGKSAKRRHKFIDYSTIERKTIAINNGKKACKPVAQFSLSGRLIKKYFSEKEAYLQTNIRHIGDCCKGHRKTSGGYIWKFEKG